MSSRTLQQVSRTRQPALIPDEVFPNLAPDVAGQHGEVFTRKWVVELILDLAGYTVERDLAELIAVEPACGTGAFLGPLVERLSASCRQHGRSISDARNALRAYDLLPETSNRHAPPRSRFSSATAGRKTRSKMLPRLGYTLAITCSCFMTTAQ